MIDFVPNRINKVIFVLKVKGIPDQVLS